MKLDPIRDKRAWAERVRQRIRRKRLMDEIPDERFISHLREGIATFRRLCEEFEQRATHAGITTRH